MYDERTTGFGARGPPRWISQLLTWPERVLGAPVVDHPYVHPFVHPLAPDGQIPSRSLDSSPHLSRANVLAANQLDPPLRLS